jgi:DNA repair ATPase RecN
VESVRNAYLEWVAAKREQSEALNALQGAQDVDYLRFQFDELVHAGVGAGTYESLHDQHQLLANASGLKSALDALLVSVEGEGGASDLLLRAAKNGLLVCVPRWRNYGTWRAKQSESGVLWRKIPGFWNSWKPGWPYGTD